MHKLILNFEDKEIIDKLKKLGYTCIPTIKSERVSEGISCHADVLYLKLDNINMVISACQKENFQLLQDNGFNVVVFENLKPGYKTESYLNVINYKNTLIYNPKTAIECDFFDNLKEKIKVNQGYTRCSTILVNENAFITEDEGIYSALKNNKKDCLLISKGYAKLDGYDYGFIGGASVMLENSILFFFGDITHHPEKNKIIEFLKKYNITVQYIKNKPLTDIGGAIII